MKCASCGAEVVEKSVFCHKCGHRMAAGAEAISTPPAGSAAPAGDPDRVLWEGSFSPKAMYGTYLTCAVLSIAALVGGLIFFAPMWPLAAVGAAAIWLWPLGMLAYRKLAVHYKLSPQRFIHQRGILKRVTDRIEVIDMDDIAFEQGIIERMLGVGTLRITSSDRTHPKIVLPGIDEVAKVAAIIDDARRAERNRRGVYIESI